MKTAAAIDSEAAWQDMNRELPEILEQLLACQSSCAENPPAEAGRGIYVFSDRDDHLYVGRTGITARARKAGAEPSTSFTARWRQHTGVGSPPNSAPFAMKLAHELTGHFDVPGPRAIRELGLTKRTADWWKLRNAESPPAFYFAFQEAKRFIREDLAFRCTELIDDVRGVRSHVAEVYADAVLQTTYGDFSPS